MPFSPTTAKESLFEGGVRVPFVVAGWGVAAERWGQHSQELVNVVDVFPTVCSLASVSEPQRTIDGVNLRPYMRARPASGLRTFSYAEVWNNGNWSCFGGSGSPDRVYRSMTYGVNWKIHYSNSPTQSVFYDLSVDPCERVPFLWDDPVVQPFQAGLWSEVALLLDPATCNNFCK